MAGGAVVVADDNRMLAAGDSVSVSGVLTGVRAYAGTPATVSVLLWLLLFLKRAPWALESGPSMRHHLVGLGREDS